MTNIAILQLTMPDKAYTGETVKAQATAENMADTNLTWTVEKGGQTIPLSDVAVGTPNSSGVNLNSHKQEHTP